MSPARIRPRGGCGAVGQAEESTCWPEWGPCSGALQVDPGGNQMRHSTADGVEEAGAGGAEPRLC